MKSIQEAVNEFTAEHDANDAKFPNRHKEIHTNCCPQCPTKHCMDNGIIDPEAEDIRPLPKELIARDFLFVCAWRTNKLCKGLCDDMGITQDFLNELYK